MNLINKVSAIKSLCPTVDFVWSYNKEDNLDVISNWSDVSIKQPTEDEIQAEITRLQTEYDSQQYARDRAVAYPSLTDQADMAYWDRKNGTTTLDDAITAVKAEFPKP